MLFIRSFEPRSSLRVVYKRCWSLVSLTLQVAHNHPFSFVHPSFTSLLYLTAGQSVLDLPSRYRPASHSFTTMHLVSVYNAIVLGLLAGSSVAVSSAASGSQDLQGRYIVSISAASISIFINVQKGSGASLATKFARSIISGIEARHHTEAQIAAKEAATTKKNHGRDAQAPDEFGPWDSEVDEFGSWVDKREPHHTEAQIAAKQAAAKKKAGNKREPHHTEAQIAAKEATSKKKTNARDAQAPDEFGPWDSEEDEFGSWVDKREPHHTEAQIAAKEAAGKKKNQAREPHHTEAQIAAKEKAGKAAKGN
jgi:hypothetical protein